MTRASETVHESSLTLANNDETVYVAVEKDVDKSIVTLTWALNYFRGKKFCIFHVHQLAKVIALIGGNSPGSSLEEHEVRTIRELDTKMMEKILDDYIFMCEQEGMYAEKLHVEMDDIGEGIVELVYQHSIKKLVVGAAADKHYSEGMKNIKSKKAMYVLDHVPPSCQIWFICSGNLIRSGKGGLDGSADEDRYASLQSISFSEMGGSHPSTSASGSSNLRCCDDSESELEVLEPPRFLELEHLSSSHELDGSIDDQLLDQLEQAQEEAGKWRREAYEEANRREKAEKAVIEATRKVRALEGSYIEELRRRKEIEEVFAKEKGNFENLKKQWDEERLIAMDQRGLLENQVSNYEYRMKELDEKLLTAMDQRVLLENQVSNIEYRMKELDEERLTAMDQRVLLENQVSNYEFRMKELDEERLTAMDQRVLLENQVSNYEYRIKELDEERLTAMDQRGLLENQVSNYEYRMKELDEELLTAMDQRVLLENQVSNYEYRMKELDEERLTSMDQRVLLENQVSNYEFRMEELEKERDEFRVERDNAFDVSNYLLTKQSEASSSSSIINTQQFFSVFSLSEIHEATSSFDPSSLIWEHGYGTMYKGLLRYTPVAIKMLNTTGGTSVFQEEVDVLSKFRHPNLITLIGVCPEEYGLIYEYLPNGCLRDRLSCKDNTPPLSWQTRICIATELCSALIFLHSSNPHSIVHGDLKAENIFLDAGFVSKLSGFGISNHPQFLETGELSPKSDIYSFGIIILQLLTGRSRANIVERMREILDMGNLNALLDSSAGDWPFVQAQQVAHLALRCCDSDPSNRPDLVSEVWRVLKPLSASSSIRMDSEEDSQSPSYFICPILQEVMQDPVVAADGYTYEEEALREWLDSGHNTSPMTNLRLSHTDLVPNRALRSAIQEWLQNPS
ncbi:hypothetical protein LWI28_021851 [Acer negundo]|uniref:RING-type E3 ubiquitin transferase n=1 Tax=Acer negundo TaxID=4023 RepID=A0AAD5J0M9_ACENE|nr:hypothetical protein LWI28_021851 [Acer negundo]